MISSQHIHLKRLALQHADEVANTSIGAGIGLFGVALADLATILTIVAGVLSIVGLSLGIYLKTLQIRLQRKREWREDNHSGPPEDIT